MSKVPVRRVLAVLGACAASAVLLRLSYPVPGWFPLAWVALMPWFVVLRAGSGRAAILSAAATGLAFAGLALSWQFLVTVAGGSLLAVYVASYFVLFAGLVRAATRRLRVPFVLAAPVLWAGCEYLRSFALTGFPWLFVGHTQQPFTAIVQVADLFGAYAVSLVVVAANAFVAELAVAAWRRDAAWRRVAAGGAFAAAAFAATLGYGLWRLGGLEWRQGPRVGIVQTNVPQDIKNEMTLENITHIFVQQTRLTHDLMQAAGGQKLDLIVCPESMVEWPLNRQDVRPGEDFLEILEREAKQTGCPLQPNPPGNFDLLLMQLARQAGCAILVGAHTEIGSDAVLEAPADGVVKQVSEDTLELGDYVYTLPRDPDPATGEEPILRLYVKEGQQVKQGDKVAELESIVHNSAYLFRPDEPMGIDDRYDKNHLVPFGEYMPLHGLLWFLRQVVPYGKGFTPGNRLNLMRLGTSRFGVLICFEDAFPRIVRRYVVRPDGRGADFLVNISNDGWFRGSHELDQHLALCAFRAVEFRIGIVRSVNSGISAIIDPDGRIQQIVHDEWGRTKLIEGVAIGRVALREGLTFYARHGDVFAQVCLGFASFVCLAAAWARLAARRRPKRNSRRMLKSAGTTM